jgi:hypothetical protein
MLLGERGIGPFFQPGEEGEILALGAGFGAWIGRCRTHQSTGSLGQIAERGFRWVCMIGLPSPGSGAGSRLGQCKGRPGRWEKMICFADSVRIKTQRRLVAYCETTHHPFSALGFCDALTT